MRTIRKFKLLRNGGVFIFCIARRHHILHHESNKCRINMASLVLDSYVLLVGIQHNDIQC